MFHVGSARFVKKILEEEQPDVVHTHNLMGLGFLIPRVIRKLSIHHVHTVHDVQLVEPSGIILKQKEHHFRYGGLPTRAYSWVMKQLMGSPEVIISPSQFLLDFYTDRGFFRQSKKILLRNPITFDIAEYAPHPDEHIFRFLYLGQVEEHKGVELLIDAFKGLSLSDSVQLHIVGSGSVLRDIEESVKGYSRIQIYGRMRRGDLPGLFRKMNMVVVPSLCYENSPTVIFESFAFGLPVLASNIEGIAELIREGENGMTFQAGDIASLQEKMAWCIAHSSAIAQMGKKTAQSLDGLSLDQYIDTLEDLYKITGS
jgi:glycosyltransferase involved in cell wall biosynthesis